MDRSDSNVSLALVQLCRARRDGYWELLAAAAHEPVAYEQCVSALNLEELRQGALSDLAVSPSIVELRVEALSVAAPGMIDQLHDNLRREPEGNEFIDAARRYCQAFIRKDNDKLDPNAKPWRWRAHLQATPIEAAKLSLRPLIDLDLSPQDIADAIAVGGGVLRALRHQAVDFTKDHFLPWLQGLAELDPWVLALLIELARKSGPDAMQWSAAYLPHLQNFDDARSAIPAVYALLSSNWTVL